MKELMTISYDKVKFNWISEHYNIHLHGTCYYNNKLCEFKTNINDITKKNEIRVKVYRLSTIEKIKWKLNQFLFEICVGYHWTYGKNIDAKFYYRKPTWLYIYYYLIFIIKNN